MRQQWTAIALAGLAGSAAISEPTAQGVRAGDDQRAQHVDRRALGERAERLQRQWLSDRGNDILREEARQALRDAIMAGGMSPFKATFTDVVESIYDAPEATNLTASLSAEEFEARMDEIRANNPYPWSADIAYGEDFDWEGYTPHVSLSSLADLNRLAGQVALNGNVWKTASTRVYNGLLDNTTAQTGVTSNGMGGFNPPGSGYFGVPGGPDPTGEHGQFMASPRGSMYDLTSTAFDTSFQWVARLDHAYFHPIENQPVINMIDWYMDSLETFTWFRPVNSPEGCIVTNIFMGGIDFATFAPFTNDDNIIDRPITLGLKPGSPDEGEFFVAANHRLKAREWFQLATRQGVDTFSIWIRDSETRGDNASGLPYDAPGYESEIFDTGWVQWFPGFDDDPGTTAIEGSGVAVNTFGQQADHVTGADGNTAGGILFAFGVEEIQVVGGFDWPPAFAPNYKPTDWYFDNHSIIGVPFEFAKFQPPTRIPYVDDIERWTPGAAAVQGDRWFVPMSFAQIVTSQNHTPGVGSSGLPATKSVLLPNVFVDNAYRSMLDLELFEVDFEIRATGSTPLVFQSWFRMLDHETTYGVYLHGKGESAARLFLGARDGSGMVDDQLYLELTNPEYDESQPEPDMVTRNVVWNGVQNRSHYPAPLIIDGTSTPATLPRETWFQLEIRVELQPGARRGDIRIMLDGQPLAIDSAFFDALGAPTPSADGIAGVRLDEISIECGFEPTGGTSKLWWDDIFIDGAGDARPTVLTVDSEPFTTQPTFELPYIEPFDGYLPELALSGQGATPYLGDLYTNFNNQIDVITPAVGVAPGTPVYLYEVTSINDQQAALPAGVQVGAVVGVVDNVPDARNPNFKGSPSNSTRAVLRDSDRSYIATVEWWPQSQTPVAWDGVTPVIGRYFFVYESRWQGDPTEPYVIDVESDHPGHGSVAAITQDFVGFRGSEGRFFDALTSTLPMPALRPGERSHLEVDLFIESSEDTPLGRTALDVLGPTVDEFRITQIAFGGPNIYVDLDDDGLVDDDHSSLAQDASKLYVLRPNAHLSSPPGLLVEEPFVVPVNQWFRVALDIARDGNWDLEIADQSRATVFSTSGQPIDDAGDPYNAVPGTAGLDIQLGNDDGGAGRAPLLPIVWTSLGSAAPPEDGVDPHDTDYNSVPAKYFYFEVLTIDAFETPDLSALPDVTEVDLVTGSVLGVRDLEVNDVVVLLNDTGSGSGSLTGTPYATVHPRNQRWQYSDDNGASMVAGGWWGPLGLPGKAGLNDPVPPGGITATAPPYTSVIPFRTLLMGAIVDLPPYPEARPPHRVLVDNLVLDLTGCLMDLNGDSSVDPVDLAVLLADWGSDVPERDANRDGVINGQDLAALLTNWGVCEGNE